jgi:hypothetical protein
LPTGVDAKRAAVLADLDIELVTFTLSSNRIMFNGLETIAPGVSHSAPLRASKQ